jgi:hypothetical protein
MNNIYKAFAALSVGLAVFACKKDEYVPAELEPVQTYVGADITAPRNIDADGSVIEIPFTRNKVAEALDITVFLEDASGIFTLDNTALHFDVGQATATALLTYSYDALVPETVYNLKVELASTEYASQYRPVAFPIAAKKAWKKIPAVFYDDWWTEESFDKTLLKAPDGTETYRLVSPWTKADLPSFLSWTGGMEYFEFTIDEEGAISWGGKTGVVNTPFTYSGMTTHMLHPAQRKDEAGVAANKLLGDGVAQIVYYPVLKYSSSGYSWFGTSTYAIIDWSDSLED